MRNEAHTGLGFAWVVPALMAATTLVTSFIGSKTASKQAHNAELQTESQRYQAMQDYAAAYNEQQKQAKQQKIANKKRNNIIIATVAAVGVMMMMMSKK